MFFSASKPIVNTIEGYDPKAAFNPREMHLNILKLMLNQALRDNEDSGH